MRVPISWLREYVALPDGLTAEALAARLTSFDLKLEEIVASDVRGPLVVGRVLSFESEEHKNGKTVRWCQVDVGEDEPRGIVCGAHNFAEGDLIVAVLPGAVLPGGFEISARKTYGHVSDGMICSARELGLGDDHDGIMVLEADAGQVGDDAIALLGLDDVVLDLEVNPDRAYALSLRGVARDAAIAYEVRFDDPAAIAVAGEGEAYPVVVEAPDACPVFSVRTVSGFDPGRPTPSWIARRVQAAGMRPISLAVDITNYVMLELGQPIHGYDGQRLSGPIVVRRAKEGDKLTTLDGVARTLAATDLLITDDSGPIGLAGVMGGENTELHAETTDIVIEAAYFEPTGIAHTARTHKLPSEASKRFERGVDPALGARAAQRVAELLVEHGGGTIDDGLTVVGSVPEPPVIELPEDLPERVTGVEIGRSAVVDALVANGCAVEGDTGLLHVVPPTWRYDLTDPYDLVEEVIRVVGYDQVPSVLPVAPAGRGLTAKQRLRRRVGRAASGAGYVEVKTFPFVGPADWDRLGLAADDPRRRIVELENPLSTEEPGLTTSLLPLLLRAASRNAGRGQPDLALYELAPVFLPGEAARAAPILPVSRRPSADEIRELDAALPAQPLHLGAVLTGDRSPAGWWGDARPATWADAIALVRQIARVLAVDIEVTGDAYVPWHPGRCAAIRVGGETIGHAGELHPRVVRAYDLPERAAAVEIDLDVLLAAATEVVRPEPLSHYPVAKEDVALIVDVAVPSAAVAEALRRGAGDLLESVRLFDVYTGEPVPAGSKSLAYALRFRAPDRTLTEAETAVARDAAVAAAAADHGAVQRA
ncbi:phenylalanine--tRNA ligase subunit beta [Solicola gregarius]|uniref:Phenylalanine--tRNA ligase beta subunit n=1 Tax=Solicola gregarius TaxID=2908642 RepID=A0AA46TH18_9ACTN|nr:phenylalanine--tRNA ligase subunit beta [Solicola gregarius]UYM05212.1 phenylalanine--tRNA ligase subunit beta [Solicola gregarius]